MLRNLCTLIGIALVGFALPKSAAAQTVPNDPAALADRFINLEGEETVNSQPIKDLVDIDPELGFTVLRENWTKIRSQDGKMSLINTFLAMANPHMVEVIHLGATDPNLKVQDFAMKAAETIGFKPVSEDYSAYLDWHKSVEGQSLQQVLDAGVKDFVAKFSAASDIERETLLGQLLTKQFAANTKIARARRKAILDAGILAPLVKSLNPKAGFTSNQLALQFAVNIRPDSEFLKTAILPLTAKDAQMNLRMQALQMIGRPDNTWANDTLLKMYVDEYPEDISYNIGTALGAIGDAHALPTLIGMLDADNTREGAITIGNVLFQVTGVYVQEAHDAAWWHNWLTKNQQRLPADVRAAPIPKIALHKRVPDFNAGIAPPYRSELRHANADPHSAYWLIIPNNDAMRVGINRNFNNNGGAVRVVQVNGRNIVLNNAPVPAGVRAVAAQAPQAGKLGLLVVLANGDGNGANALPFWSELCMGALKGRYMIALPVAPRWNANQTVAWITADSRKQVTEAKFTTESLVADVVKDVSGAYPFDTARVFLHGAAESGPAVYAASLEPGTPFKGFYVLASAFKSTQLPPLKQAKGRRYFLQNSKDNKATPFVMAAAAQKLLQEQGAVVKLDEYAGKTAYEFAGGAEKVMGAAIAWLEGGK